MVITRTEFCKLISDHAKLLYAPVPRRYATDILNGRKKVNFTKAYDSTFKAFQTRGFVCSGGVFAKISHPEITSYITEQDDKTISDLRSPHRIWMLLYLSEYYGAPVPDKVMRVAIPKQLGTLSGTLHYLRTRPLLIDFNSDSEDWLLTDQGEQQLLNIKPLLDMYTNPPVSLSRNDTHQAAAPCGS